MTGLLTNALTAAVTTMLFVGNSYTFGNGGLWWLTSNIYNSTSSDTLLVEHITAGGATLENHWNDPAVRAALQNPLMDRVIFQEQSCMPVIDPERTYTWGDSLALFALNNGVEPSFLMTWARRNDPLMLKGLEEGYSRLARVNQCPAAPCGIAFELCMKEHSEIDLYGGDGAHPSMHGSYLAALVIAASVLNSDITGTGVWYPDGVTGAEAAVLRSIAAETCSTWTQPVEELLQ